MSHPTDDLSLVLTLPQRLAAANATAAIRSTGSRQPVHAAAGAVALLPTERVWGATADPRREQELTARLTQLGVRVRGRSRARVSVGGRDVPALPVPGLGPKVVRSLLARSSLDVAWLADRRGLRAVTPGPVAAPRVHPDDPGAVADGARLPDLLRRRGADRVGVPRRRVAERLGWVPGGPLDLSCDTCGSALEWCDWWHAAAVDRRATWFAWCPGHGAAVTTHGGRPLEPLVDARRRLDAALWAGASGAPRRCYVIEVQGLGAGRVYVGQTSKQPDQRLAEHRGGQRAAKVFTRAGASAGSLRPDLLGDLPALGGTHQALAAERWVAARLRHAGYRVDGGH